MSDRPITLEAMPTAGGITVRVLAVATEAIDAAFSLEVTAGTNRSVHRGTASLGAGDRATLASISASVVPGMVWDARLRVEPSGAAPYEQVDHGA